MRIFCLSFLLVTCSLFLFQNSSFAFFFKNKELNNYTKKEIPLNAGIMRHLINIKNDRGPVVVNVLEIDLHKENIIVQAGLINPGFIRDKATLLNIAERYMAFAGINANYFDIVQSYPIGTLITGGDWLVGPIYNRVAIGFREDKSVIVEQAMISGFVSIYRGLFKKKLLDKGVTIDCLNTPPHLCSGVSIFKPNWGKELYLKSEHYAFVVEDNCIKKRDTRKVKIPEDGFVLVGSKNTELEEFKKWDCLKLEWNYSPGWENVVEAVSGGPYLVKDGDIYIDEEEENVHFRGKDQYAPRTAIGVDKDNKLFLITVDGRQPGYSVGLSLLELAELLKNFGLTQVINLDGGGSTTMVIDGKVVNKPSDEGGEREVSNGLLIFVKDE